MKPKLFIGSSSEGKKIGLAIQAQLEGDVDVVVWNQGVFTLGGNVLDDLLQQLEDVDFGLFILSPDDLLKIRGEEIASARDNVILELGLFFGRLGKNRTFFVTPRDTTDFRIPSDLLGVIAASFDAAKLNDNMGACLGPTCYKVLNAIQRTINDRTQLSQTELKRTRLRELILNCFKLYKAALGVLPGHSRLIRVSLLKYLPLTNQLQMLIQDDTYEDKGFSSIIPEGANQGIVVCEAAQKAGLIARDLPEDLHEKYPNSQIPYSLKSVIAFPVWYKRGNMAGIVALDSELSLEEFGIEPEKLSATFLKLCDLVEGLIRDYEDQIEEI